MDKLHKTAELLLEKEKIDADEFDAVFGVVKEEAKQEEVKEKEEPQDEKEAKVTKTRKKKTDM